MCGIIAVVRRRSERTPPSPEEISSLLDPVGGLLRDAAQRAVPIGELTEAGDRLAQADLLLRGVPGVRALVADRSLLSSLDQLTAGLEAEITTIEMALDHVAALSGPDLEALNASLVRIKDKVWAIRNDRLRTARAVAALAGPDPGPAALSGFTSVQQALSALDRLEVRGRDSAGLHLLVRNHELDLDSPAVRSVLAERPSDPLFGSMAVRTPDGHLSFVYKAAAEIGELGDNTAAIRQAITDDDLLHRALTSDEAEVVVLGHTRWASVGIISPANAHPLNSDELDRNNNPYVIAVLNGDVDNFADLKAIEGLSIAPEITTDAKVIPTLLSRRLARSGDASPAASVEAFRSTAALLDGSVAIAANTATEPGQLLLALRGSGQALYVGLAEDAFVVASEPYGLVEETDRYLRLDGETPADAGNPATRGQLVHLDDREAGTLAGVRRWAYDGTELPVRDGELASAEITTRDIDRGTYPHFLLKEISEAPASFRKTLRGKLIEIDGYLDVRLGPDVLPESVRSRLRSGAIRRILVIGQGTAAVAGQSLAGAMAVAAPKTSVSVSPVLATELSGFSLDADMSDALVVAISQSGTTTDTNRTVDLVRGRGAAVLAIVNRRGSDLTEKADGVLYTSDGRDVEMSVASTKAFYSQIAASFLVAFAIAEELPDAHDDRRRNVAERQELLSELRRLPELMERTLTMRPEIAMAAQQFAPRRRYWAVVGNGVNRIAANEVRIKLSELCYKSISCDATEDKKHIDLSCEPLIVVCAAGLAGSTADDVAKEVAIFRAHKAAPIVIASEGEERFGAALQAILVPRTHPGLGFVLSAMVGHVFGYEAAVAIDAEARPLREARAAIESAVAVERVTEDPDHLLERLGADLAPMAGRYFDGLRSGDYDGNLEASTAVRLASLFRYGLGIASLESYQVEYGRVGTPSVVIEDLTDSLTRAIEELTRPVDAIKHQAKTVTVGISRSDETLLAVPLVQAVLATGVARDRLSYNSLRTLAALEPLVDEVLGYTRYRVEGSLDGDGATAVVVDRGGLGRELRSRTEDNPVLRGTKHRVASERQVLLARGRSDGRTVLIVPEVKDNQATGLTLLHVGLEEDLPLPTVRSILQGYRNRYAALRDAVTETEPSFRDDLLSTIPPVELMTDPIYDLADRWRS